jgi:hypothetical protein
MIKAQIIADSICNGHRITTMKVTMPRIILPEFNTHRMLSKNSASSRAIPLNKMVEMVRTNPFIPIAWQKDHRGMQGTEYHEGSVANGMQQEWLHARERAIGAANYLHFNGLTKQLCNRLLEPFMWHTVLVTATEFENFFHLRCPQYHWKGHVFRSKKDALNHREAISSMTDVDWLYLNKGQAEIHMMALAEAMWDARNESTPKELQPGQWHIPYGDLIQFKNTYLKEQLTDVMSAVLETITGVKDLPVEVPLATAVCAQTSYTVIGEGDKLDKDNITDVLMDIHNSLLIRPHTNRKGVVFGPDDPKHMSPAEHCAQAMTEEEIQHDYSRQNGLDSMEEGWCHNLRGWKSYRSMIPNENRR